MKITDSRENTEVGWHEDINRVSYISDEKDEDMFSRWIQRGKLEIQSVVCSLCQVGVRCTLHNE